MSFAAHPKVLRSLATGLFISSGVFLTLTGLFGAPSFWYLPCFAILVPLGLLWIWKPGLAASLAVGPFLAVVILLFGLRGSSAVVLAMVVVSGILLLGFELRRFPRWKVPVAASLLFLFVAFIVDRRFTNVVTVKTFTMQVAMDGKVPWGVVAAESIDGPQPVVVYRSVDDTYCYDALYSPEIRNRLAGKQQVRVDYNLFSDFGQIRGYNIRSVDGLLLANGDKIVRSIDYSGGTIGMGGKNSADCRS